MTNSRDFQDAEQVRQLSGCFEASKPRAKTSAPTFSGLAALGRYSSFAPVATAPQDAHVSSLVEEDIDAMA